jgi:biopolymer transport protein ExbB
VGIDGTKIYSRIAAPGEKTFETERSTDLALNQWHQLMVTVAPDQRLTLFLDGLQRTYVNLPGGLPELNHDIVIGAAQDGSHVLMGDLDEVGLSNKVREAAWARLAYASQGPDGLLYTFGEEEVGGGGGLPVFYLGTILKNITFDGWLILGLLVILMIASWVVFLAKAFFLWVTGRENSTFLSSFNSLDDPVASHDPDKGKGYENSNLYRLYDGGCRTVKENGHKSQEKLIKALTTNLEKSFIEESKRLNAWLVLLTMAITGGPFLGLLGTVWGVMNTFAAMAEAGEANIMAIAPGVASALSTTVFGLLVAIPALFAYNYLTSRIKSITADLTVFIDQFVLEVDNAHGGAA